VPGTAEGTFSEGEGSHAPRGVKRTEAGKSNKKKLKRMALTMANAEGKRKGPRNPAASHE